MKKRILGALTVFRTATLGGHDEACESCGEVKVLYNSVLEYLGRYTHKIAIAPATR